MPVTWRYQPPAVSPVVALLAVKAAATEAGAKVLLAKSEPLVPEDTGALKASGTVSADGESARVSYSAVAEDGYDYAVIQHERLDYHHEHGQAKYLEAPMHSEHAAVGAALAAVFKAAL